MTSPSLKVAIGLDIRFGVPFVERAKWIVSLPVPGRFFESHTLIADLENEFIACLKAKCGADRSWNGGLGLGRELAGNHWTSIRVLQETFSW
jgi:hypothetical protein